MNTYKIEITTDDTFSNDGLRELVLAVIDFMNKKNMRGGKIVEAYLYDANEQDYTYCSGFYNKPEVE